MLLPPLLQALWKSPCMLMNHSLQRPVVPRAVIDHGVSQWGTYFYDGVSYSHDQVMDLCAGLVVLYLFSGPRRDGDFSEACLELGAKAKLIDIELNEPLMDVLDEAIFDTHLSHIKARKYDAALMAMPCSTFSRSRDVCDGGPKPLRGCGDLCQGTTGSLLLSAY